MPKKPDRAVKVHAALTRAGRPSHVATHVAKKCSAKRPK